MKPFLVRAAPRDVKEYIRIAKLTASAFNVTLTNPVRVYREVTSSAVYMIKVVIENEDKSVGFISYVTRKPDHVYISEVQVEPDFQGRGIGRAALLDILEELGSVETIDLHTHPDNPAQHLYERCGFRQVGGVFQHHQAVGGPRMRMVLVRE